MSSTRPFFSLFVSPLLTPHNQLVSRYFSKIFLGLIMCQIIWGDILVIEIFFSQTGDNSAGGELTLGDLDKEEDSVIAIY